MIAPFPNELITQALGILETEASLSTAIPALSSALQQAVLTEGQQGASLSLGEHLVALQSRHGTLTFFLPPDLTAGKRQRLASLDRHGRLLLLLYRTPKGNLTHFKVRGLDGRSLGVVRSAASHLGWGDSDCVWLLDGEDGFALDRSL